MQGSKSGNVSGANARKKKRKNSGGPSNRNQKAALGTSENYEKSNIGKRNIGHPQSQLKTENARKSSKNERKSSEQLATDLKSKQFFFSQKSLDDPAFSANEKVFKKLCSSVNIDRPSRIQALSWPALLSGKHAIVADQTGSGKTLGYLLPLLQRMKLEDDKKTTSDMNLNGASQIKLLILAPTAELCDQIRNVCAMLAGKSGVRFRTMVATANGLKSAPIREQIRELQNSNVDVLVSTPGRVAAFLKSGALDLSYLQAVVLDEVDVLMVDETFGPQLRTVGVAAPSKTQVSLMNKNKFICGLY